MPAEAIQESENAKRTLNENTLLLVRQKSEMPSAIMIGYIECDSRNRKAVVISSTWEPPSFLSEIESYSDAV